MVKKVNEKEKKGFYSTKIEEEGVRFDWRVVLVTGVVAIADELHELNDNLNNKKVKK